VHGRLAEQAAAEPLIQVQTDVQVIRLDWTGARPLVHARAGNGESLLLPCDAVLAAVGRRRSLPILPGNMVPATDALTPLPGLYICGDARRGALGQAVMAAGDGMAAAVDIARAGSLH
jgi:thioredoxin reductase